MPSMPDAAKAIAHDRRRVRKRQRVERKAAIACDGEILPYVVPACRLPTADSVDMRRTGARARHPVVELQVQLAWVRLSRAKPAAVKAATPGRRLG